MVPKHEPTTPVKNTPIKQLPFSPSQFLNSPNLSFDVTLASTPVKKQPLTPTKENRMDYSPLSTPNPLPLGIKSENRLCDVKTPNKNSIYLSENSIPRTPTPFKRALAEIEKKSGALKSLPQTPTRLEDITEIMKKDQEMSTYDTDCSSNYIQVRRAPLMFKTSKIKLTTEIYILSLI